MNLESYLQQGMTPVGEVDGVRQSYFVFEATDLFFLFSLSSVKPSSGNFNVVARKSVEFVYARFRGQEDVSTNDVVERARRSQHAPDALSALNILYVLVAQRRACINGTGRHSKLLFSIQDNATRKASSVARAKSKVKKRPRKRSMKKRPTLVRAHDEYRDYLFETYKQVGEASSSRIRVRPLAGQGLDGNMKVRCSKALRSEHPIGTIFRLKAKVTSREGGTPFLHAPHTWPYEVITPKRARTCLSGKS